MHRFDWVLKKKTFIVTSVFVILHLKEHRVSIACFKMRCSRIGKHSDILEFAHPFLIHKSKRTVVQMLPPSPSLHDEGHTVFVKFLLKQPLTNNHSKKQEVFISVVLHIRKDDSEVHSETPTALGSKKQQHISKTKKNRSFDLLHFYLYCLFSQI